MPVLQIASQLAGLNLPKVAYGTNAIKSEPAINKSLLNRFIFLIHTLFGEEVANIRIYTGGLLADASRFLISFVLEPSKVKVVIYLHVFRENFVRLTQNVNKWREVHL